MEWFCSCLPVILIGSALGVPLTIYAGWLAFLWSRQREMRTRALREACAVCDAPVDEAGDGTYKCSKCGFNMGWRDDPQKRNQVEDVRELRLALMELEQGVSELELAVVYAKGNVWGLGSVDMKYAAVNRAEESFLSGLSMLQRLAKRHPRLAEMPFPTERIGELSSKDGDVDGLLGLVLSSGVRRRVRDGLVEAVKDSQACMVELEIMLEEVGEALQNHHS